MGQVTCPQSTPSIRGVGTVAPKEQVGSSHAPHNRWVAWPLAPTRRRTPPVKHFSRSLIVVALVALAAIPAATAANRMWMGFHDDPVFRWNDGRAEELDKAVFEHATIIRSLVTWANVAPTKPANPASPFDPAYKLDDVDELVRNAQQRGLEVLITIWGTPKWANGDKGPNYLPTNVNDFRQFAQALAARYSGRYSGFPFVRFYGIWNESNLGQFLSPQFNSAGAIVGPKAY